MRTIISYLVVVISRYAREGDSTLWPAYPRLRVFHGRDVRDGNFGRTPQQARTLNKRDMFSVGRRI